MRVRLRPGACRLPRVLSAEKSGPRSPDRGAGFAEIQPLSPLSGKARDFIQLQPILALLTHNLGAGQQILPLPTRIPCSHPHARQPHTANSTCLTLPSCKGERLNALSVRPRPDLSPSLHSPPLHTSIPLPGPQVTRTARPPRPGTANRPGSLAFALADRRAAPYLAFP